MLTYYLRYRIMNRNSLRNINFCCTDYIQHTITTLNFQVRIPINERCTLTKEESRTIKLAQAFRYRFLDSALDSNLRIIDCHFPFDVHGSKYHFFKSFPNLNVFTHYFYINCLLILKFEESEVEKCEDCKVEFKKSEKHKNGHYFLYVHSRFPITRSSSIGDLSASSARGILSISYLLLRAVMRII